MSLPKSEISEILYTMGDILTRLIDRVENNIEFQPFERRELLNTLYKQMCGVQIDEILSRADEKHKLQIKRGDTDKNNAYVGQPGEITMDTDAKTIRIHDGETTGGVAMARAMDTIGDWVVESQLPTAENNYTWYRKYKSGWVEQGGRFYLAKTQYDTVVLPVEMANTNYAVQATFFDINVADQSTRGANTGGYTTKDFQVKSGTYNNVYINWVCTGIAA